jgi:hypothetical protein
MELKCNGRNLYIVEKGAEPFDGISAEDGFICVKRKAANVENSSDEARICGKVRISQVYACMYCESLKNITLIIRGEEIYKVSFVMNDEKVFGDLLGFMKQACVSAHMSEQNKKINGYAAGIIEKLKEGIEIAIIESRDKEDIPCCPVCGVQCDPAIPYCMECGAAL